MSQENLDSFIIRALSAYEDFESSISESERAWDKAALAIKAVRGILSDATHPEIVNNIEALKRKHGESFSFIHKQIPYRHGDDMLQHKLVAVRLSNKVPRVFLGKSLPLGELVALVDCVITAEP